MSIAKTFPMLAKHQSLVDELSSNTQLVVFKSGDVLLKEGSYARYIPLVVSGLVKVYKEDEAGNEVLLYYINEGESCIMSATYCLHNEKSEVKAVVEQEAEIVLVPASLATTLTRKYLGWNEFLFHLFRNKYSELLHIIQILTFENKDKRLLDYLNNESKLKETTVLHTTHQKIADDIGATREVVSRLLKKLENEGHLALQHRKIILH